MKVGSCDLGFAHRMDPFSSRQRNRVSKVRTGFKPVPTRSTRRQVGIDAEPQAEPATALAIAALRFVADDPERLRTFLSLTGIDPQAIRAAAQEPGFLLGVLDHLAGDESLLIEFAQQNEIDPDEVRAARSVLAGGDQEEV
jgi:Protein of unknown function (DUF3572)